jgi:hypothetical protein
MQTFKKLIVCGDSYQTPSKSEQYSGTHWSELFAKRYDLELMTFANYGMSDTVVAFQLLDALLEENAFIVASPSAGLRMEWCEYNDTYSPPEKYTDFCRPNSQNPNALMKVVSLAECDPTNTREHVFLTNINPGPEAFKQRCMIYYALRKLKNQNRTFLFFNSIPYKDILDEELLEIIGHENLVTKAQFNLGAEYIDRSNPECDMSHLDPGYHTFPDFQVKIADYVEKRLKEIIK